MKVLFIGGTGRLSKDVAALAQNLGNQVFLLTRGSSERKLFVNDGYHMIYGNIRDTAKSKELLKDQYFDVIIDFLSYNLEQLKNTLDIIEGHYRQYIFISTATVYKKKDEEEIISEGSTAVGNDRWAYAYNKYLCEEFIKEYFENKSDADFTIVRPYVTYGNTRIPYPIVPLDTSKEWTIIHRILNLQPILTFDQGQTLTTLTHTRDFAKGVVGLFGNKKAFGEAYHITNPENVTWGQVLDTMEGILDIKLVRVDLKQEMIYDSMPQYKQILLGDKGTTMRFNNKKILRDVPSFSCEVSLDSGIREMIEFYRSHPELQKIDYRWNGEVDRLCAKQGVKNLHKYAFATAKDRKEYRIGRYLFPKMRNRMFVKVKSLVSKVIKKFVR